MLSLEEAIVHAREVAKNWESQLVNCISEEGRNKCKECASEHEQLAEWLEELQELRKKPNILFLCDRCIDKCGNACLEPNYVCSHTTDISHAKNFAHVVDDNGNIDYYVESLLDTYPEVQDVNN